MTHEQLRNLKAMLITMSAYYQHRLDDTVVIMYADDLKDLEFSDVVQALARYRKDPRHRKMPLPAEVRGLIETPLSDEDQAREAAARIVQAMSKYGYTNPDRAREFIGSVGWLIVEREGGWTSLCQRTTDDQLPVLKAQWRELARGLITRARLGQLETPPALPTNSSDMGSKTALDGPVAIGAVLPSHRPNTGKNYVDRRQLAADQGGSDD